MNRTYPLLWTSTLLAGAALLQFGAAPAEQRLLRDEPDPVRAAPSSSLQMERAPQKATLTLPEAAPAPPLAVPDRAPITDTWIRTEVKSSLIERPDIASTDIQVDSAQGRVALRGSVKSHEDVRDAEAVARAVEGVSAVENHLRVEP